MSHALADTNLLIRYLTGEPEAAAEAAKRILLDADAGKIHLRLTSLVIAEVVFVLTGKVYHYKREEVRDALLGLLDSPKIDVQDRKILISALDIFCTCGVDYVDACLAAEARMTGKSVASFDKDYDKIPEILRKDPFQEAS
jgi:predicted nucleic-acid-binding protein